MENFYLHSYKYFLNGMLRTLVTLENPKIPFDTKWFNLMFGTLYTTCFQTTRVKSDARFFSQWFRVVKQSKSIRDQEVILYVPRSIQDCPKGPLIETAHGKTYRRGVRHLFKPIRGKSKYWQPAQKARETACDVVTIAFGCFIVIALLNAVVG